MFVKLKGRRFNVALMAVLLFCLLIPPGTARADAPAPPTNLAAIDPDATWPGVDGSDFQVSWTPSITVTVVRQEIYILPLGIALEPSIQTPVVAFDDNTTNQWTGGPGLTLDSANPRAPLAEGNYTIYVVAKDPSGLNYGSTALTAVGSVPTDFTYRISGREAIITGYKGTDKDVVIPESINDTGIEYPVTAIDISVFYGLSITSVTIPTGVRSIPLNGFATCTSLNNVVFSQSGSLTGIELAAFDGCTSMTEINIPSSVASIGNKVFFNCSSLSKVYFWGTQPAFGTQVFEGTAAGFKVYYHVKNAASWSSYSAPKQAFCQLTLDLNDGSGTTSNSYVDVDSSGHIAAPADPSSPVGSFIGWYRDVAGTDDFDFASDTVSNDITLYAKWSGSVPAPVCEIVGGAQYDTLDAAIAAVPADTPTTIRLLSTINRTTTLTIEGSKKVTLDMNGHDLNINIASLTSGYDALYVRQSGSLTTTGSGTLNAIGYVGGIRALDSAVVNITGSAGAIGGYSSSYGGAKGICADGSSVSVTVNGPVRGFFAVEVSSGASVTVNGNVSGESYAAYADTSGKLTINGNVSGNGTGYAPCVNAHHNATVHIGGSVQATDPNGDGIEAGEASVVTVSGGVGAGLKGVSASGGSTVQVAGNVITTSASGYGFAAFAKESSSIEIGGDAIAAAERGVQAETFGRIVVTGDVQGEYYGAVAFKNGEVEIGGDVRVGTTGGAGVNAAEKGTVTIDGTIHADKDMIFGESDGALVTPSTKANYLTYSDGAGSYVWLKTDTEPALTVAGTAADDIAIPQIDNQTPSARDKTWEINVTTGTVKSGLTASDVTLTGLPDGLSYTVAKGTGNSIVIMLTGTASTVFMADLVLNAIVKGSAVTEAGAQDSAGMPLKLWYIGPENSFVLTNEGTSRFIDELEAAGCHSLYDALVYLRTNIPAGAPADLTGRMDRLIKIIESCPADSEVFTAHLNDFSGAGNSPVGINADGSFIRSDFSVYSYHGHTGYETYDGNAKFTYPVDFATYGIYLGSREIDRVGGVAEYDYKAFAVAWAPDAKVAGKANDNSVAMAGGNTAVSSDNSWEIELTTGTLKSATGDTLTSDDLSITGLPAGLTWSAKNNGSNKILITVDGTASPAVLAQTAVAAVIKGSAVKEADALASDPINLYVNSAAALAAPVISPNGGSYTTGQTVTITGSGGTIYYTTDGSDPETSGTVTEYTGAFIVDKTSTVKAAIKNDKEWSPVASAAFTINANPGGGGGGGGGGTVDSPHTKNETVEKHKQTEGKTPETSEPVDLTGHWAHDCIMALLAHGHIKGYPDGTIRPEQEITRAEAAVLLVNILGLQDYPLTGAASPYSDELPEWARRAILILTEKGIMTGYPDGTFGADRSITRAEMCTALMHCFPEFKCTGEAPTFADQDEIPEWALPFIQAAAFNQIVTGYPDNTFQPQGFIKRGETFVILCGLKGYHREHTSQ